MADINKNIAEDKNTGLTNNAEWAAVRYYRKDGQANVKRTGVRFFDRISWYSILLKMTTIQFIAVIFCMFLLINLFFTFIYVAIGTEHLDFSSDEKMPPFAKAFFFSVQTFTTVGYGHISPHGFGASILAAIEAFAGLLFFALASGLFYGRFTNPKAFLKYSKNAVIGPFQDINALMFRLAPYKNHMLNEASVLLTVALWETQPDGTKRSKFYNLETELSKVNALTLSWTVVHPINEKSPFWGFTADDFVDKQMELLVFIKAFDEEYNNTVISRTSYTFNELIIGAKFVPMYHRDNNSLMTVLDMNKLDTITSAELN